MHVLNTGSQSETHCHYLPASVIGGVGGGGGLTLPSFECVSPLTSAEHIESMQSMYAVSVMERPKGRT